MPPGTASKLQTLSTLGAHLSVPTQSQKGSGVAGGAKKPNLRVVIPTNTVDPPASGYFTRRQANSHGGGPQGDSPAPQAGKKRTHAVLEEESGTSPKREDSKTPIQEVGGSAGAHAMAISAHFLSSFPRTQQSLVGLKTEGSDYDSRSSVYNSHMMFPSILSARGNLLSPQSKPLPYSVCPLRHVLFELLCGIADLIFFFATACLQSTFSPLFPSPAYSLDPHLQLDPSSPYWTQPLTPYFMKLRDSEKLEVFSPKVETPASDSIRPTEGEASQFNGA